MAVALLPESKPTCWWHGETVKHFHGWADIFYKKGHTYTCTHTHSNGQFLNVLVFFNLSRWPTRYIYTRSGHVIRETVCTAVATCCTSNTVHFTRTHDCTADMRTQRSLLCFVFLYNVLKMQPLPKDLGWQCGFLWSWTSHCSWLVWRLDWVGSGRREGS